MLESGSMINQKYEVIRQLGKGGMGSVYLVKDISSGMVYALKEQTLTEKNRYIVLSETEIQARLSHPSLPQLKEYFEQDEVLYIVMEYIDGCTMQALLEKEGRIPEDRVRKWAVQLAEILCYLHGLERPVVYRDLKPSNIMIDAKDQLRLIDFGIAREYGENAEPSRWFLGLTRGYAAPEQYIRGLGADVRTDVYAFGVTMHYLLTGKNPNKPPYEFRKIRRYHKQLSMAFEEVVSTCLQPKPNKRYQTAEKLLEDLRNLDQREREIRRKRTFLYAISAAAAVLFITILSAVYVHSVRSGNARIQEYYRLLAESEAYADNGEYEKSFELLNYALQKEPDVEDAYIRIANVYRLQGDYERSFDYIADEILDRFPEIYYNRDFAQLMVYLYEDVGNEEQAEYYREFFLENE